jgi:two-component system, OmpR family, sensor histidine kinase SenX3
MPIGVDERLLEIVNALVPLAADGASIDLEFGTELACVAAVHVERSAERTLMDPVGRTERPTLEIPISSKRGIRGRLSVWCPDRPAPIVDAFACSSAAHAAAVLDASEVDQDGLLAMIGHEVRAPLQTLRMGIELLRIRAEHTVDELPREWVVERCERLERSVDRLRDVADRLLHATTVAQRVPVEPKKAELGQIVTGVVARHADELRRTGTDVIVESADPQYGEWDVVHVDTIVSNLVTNANKYAPGRPVTISITGSGDVVRIEVCDRGPGIAPADRLRVFERFGRGQGVSKVGGLGIGLWMARALAEAQGGTLACEERRGGGTTFVLELPRVAHRPRVVTSSRER